MIKILLAALDILWRLFHLHVENLLKNVTGLEDSVHALQLLKTMVCNDLKLLI